MREAQNVLANPHTQQIWHFLVTYIKQHGYAPAMIEFVAAGAASSTSVVTRHLKYLEDANLILRQRSHRGGVSQQLGRGLKIIDSEALEGIREHRGEKENS